MVAIMKRSIGVFLGSLASAALLAGCGNNNNNNVAPTPGPPCGSPPYQMEVLYPIPGSSHVTPNVGIPPTQIFVSTTTALPSGNQYDFQVSQSNGSVQLSVNNAGQPVASTGPGFYSTNLSAIPSPHVTPSYPNPVYYATNFQFPVGPLQTVTLMWNDAGTGCTPNYSVATFTTAVSNAAKKRR
jgi:hypothetical protein